MMRAALPRLVSLVSLVSLAGLALLSACSSPETKFYVLTSAASEAGEPSPGTAHLTIGVGPIELPPYLDRPQFVRRTPGNELKLTESSQWAEPLQDGFTRVLGENLSHLIPTDRVVLFPWRRSASVDYQVVVQVKRFEASTEGGASLEARWSIFRADGKSTPLTKKSSFSGAGEAGDHGALAAAMSQTILELSREIAREIRSLSTQEAGS